MVIFINKMVAVLYFNIVLQHCLCHRHAAFYCHYTAISAVHKLYSSNMIYVLATHFEFALLSSDLKSVLIPQTAVAINTSQIFIQLAS